MTNRPDKEKAPRRIAGPFKIFSDRFSVELRFLKAGIHVVILEGLFFIWLS